MVNKYSLGLRLSEVYRRSSINKLRVITEPELFDLLNSVNYDRKMSSLEITNSTSGATEGCVGTLDL